MSAMIKSRRHSKSRLADNKSKRIETSLIPWVILVLIALIIMVAINYLAGTLDLLKLLSR